MSVVNYMATGYVLDTEEDQNYRTGHFSILNPSKHDTDVAVTFYYEDQDPTQIKGIIVPNECQRTVVWIEQDGLMKNKRWGAKIESTEPIIAQETHYVRKRGDKAEDVRSQCTTMMATTTSTLWYYADGVYIVPPTPWSKRMFEPEMVGLLNPNKREAEVTMICYHLDRKRTEATFNLLPERSLWVDLIDVVGKNPKHFGARFISTEPVVVQQERQVYAIPGSPVQRSDFNEMAYPGPSHHISTLREIESAGAYHIGYFPGPNSLLVLFNPTRHDTWIDCTLYYEKEEPNMYSFGLRAETSLAIFHLLRAEPPVIKTEPWGVKVVSTEPLIMQDLCGSGYRRKYTEEELKGKPYPEALGNYKEEFDDRITWNMASRLAATTLAREWYYADGLVVKPPSKYSAKLYTPEWAFILNPMERDANVKITLYYEDGLKGEHSLIVPSNAIRGLEMENVVTLNKPYGARFASEELIVVSHNKGFLKNGDSVQREVEATMALPFPIH